MAVATGDIGAHTAVTLESGHCERQLHRFLTASRDGQVLLIELHLSLLYAEMHTVGIGAAVNR